MSEIGDIDFDYVREVVYRQSAISIESDMKYLVDSRLTSLVRKTDHSSVEELVSDMRRSRSPALEGLVVEAMTTNETSFFRDGHPFEALCKDVLPVIGRSHSDQIRIWCAACSTGQEVYTIAMSILEHCPQLASRITVLGTDISTEVVQKAKSGRYNRLEVNRGMPVQLLTKYFDQQGLSWEISEKVRRLVEFEELNLIKDWSGMRKADVIFLRNVLIYFEPDVKSKILHNTTKVLKSDGCLFLGLSETTLNLNTSYKRVTTDHSHFYKLAS